MNTERTPEHQRMFDEVRITIMDRHLFSELEMELETARSAQPRIFGLVAQSVRQCITAAIRKGYSAVGGRETIGGLRNDLLQNGLVSITKQGIFDDVLDETYDDAYALGVATEKAKRNTETDWLVELFKAMREARTLHALFVAPQQAEASDGD